MKKQDATRTTKYPDWTARATVGLTIAIVIASFLQWDVIRGQLRETTSEQRAWLSVGDVVLDQTPTGNDHTAEMHFTNLGQLPAHDVVSNQQGWDYAPDKPNNNFDRTASEWWRRCKTIVPPHGANIAFRNVPKVFSTKLSQPIGGPIDQGVRAYVLFGCFSYRTQHHVHHTSFCRWYYKPNLRGQTFGECNVANQAD